MSKHTNRRPFADRDAGRVRRTERKQAMQRKEQFLNEGLTFRN